MRVSLVFCVCALTLFFVQATFCSAKTLEELLVEKGVITKEEAASAAKETSPAAAAKVYWKGGTHIDIPSDGFTLKFNSQIQSRYTFDDQDNQRNTSSFDIVRARIILSGTAYYDEFEYLINFDLVGKNQSTSSDGLEGTSNSPNLRDAFILWHLTEPIAVRMGQFKTNFDLQYNAQSAALQFPDRSIASDYFHLGRQQGAELIYKPTGDVVINVGLYNGSSDLEGANNSGVDTNMTGAVSARANVIGGMDPAVEGDIDYSDDFQMNIGGAYAYGSANISGDSGLISSNIQSAEADTTLKWKGASFIGEFIYSDISEGTGGESSTPIGAYLQAGYFLTPKEYEVASRYSIISCDDGTAPNRTVGTLNNVNINCQGSDNVQEVGVSLNYYFWKNYLKAQVAWDLISTDPVQQTVPTSSNNRWMVQLSSFF